MWEASGLSTPRSSDGSRASPRTTPRSAAKAAASGLAHAAAATPSTVTKSRRRPARPSLTSYSQNLVAVLNDPTRPRDPDLFTRDWGDAFIPPAATNNRDSSFKHGRLTEQRRLSTDGARSRAKAPQRAPSAAEHIPPIFYEPDFNITLPETFEAVLDPARLTAESASLKHEKFGDYLDSVESKLSQALADRSDKFFDALTEQQTLHHQVLLALDDIRDLRHELARAQREAADDDLRFLQLLGARDNAYALYQKLATLQTVSQTPATIQLLLHTGDFVEALDLIATTEEIVRSELAGIHCLKHFVGQLQGMEDVVHTMMRQEFVKSLLDELGMVTTSAAAVGEVRLHGIVARYKTVDPDGDERCDRMRALLTGITRQQRFDFTTMYRKAVLGILQDVIRQHISGASGSGTAGSGGTIAASVVSPTAGSNTRLQQMPFDDWLHMLMGLLRILLLLLLQVDSTHQRIRHVFNTLQSDADTTISDANSRSMAATPSTTPAQSPDRRGRSGISMEESHSSSTRDEKASGSSENINENLTDIAVSSLDPIETLDEAAAVSANPSADALAILDGTRAVGSISTGSENANFESEKARSNEGRSKSQPSGEVATVTPTTGVGWSAKEFKLAIRESERVVTDICDEMHSRISRMVLTRKRDNGDANISVDMFVQEFNLIGEFMECTEAVSRRPCVTLRGTVHTQAKEFITLFHNKQKEKLAHLLGNERWSRANVPCECQDVVNWLATRPQASGDNTDLKKSDSIPNSESDHKPAASSAAIAESGTSASLTDSAAAPITPAVSKSLRIVDTDFRVVGALLMYLRIIKDYMFCAESIAPLAHEVMTKLFENLRLFNTRTKKLVLQMGALDLGLGLQTISAKNLALASQALGAILALIELMTARFEAILPPKMRVFTQEFERVSADYTAHRTEIEQQLVSIMDNEWERQAEKMNWVKMSTTAGAKTVAANSKQMHKVLRTVLPSAEVAGIFRKIMTAYNKRLRTAAVNRGQNGKAVAVGIVADVVHFEEVLGPLTEIPIEFLREGLDTLGLVLPAFVREVA